MYLLGRGYCLAGLIPAVVGAAGEQREEQSESASRGLRIQMEGRSVHIKWSQLLYVHGCVPVSQYSLRESIAIGMSGTRGVFRLSSLSCVESNVVLSLISWCNA